MASAVHFMALILVMDKISLSEYNQIISARSGEEMAEIAGRLYKTGQISARERDDLISAVVQDLLFGRSAEAEEEARVQKARAMIGKDDYYVSGRKGSPVVQGGLPSLGKRRP